MLHFNTFKTILELKRYSNNTIGTYLNFLKVFTSFLSINEADLNKLSDKDVILAIVKIVKTRYYGISSQKQLIGAVNLFYNELYKRNIDFSVIYPSRKEQHLPYILSKNEIKQILNSTKNIKHKAILTTIYGLGLRISEAVNLKVNDIDSQRMLVMVQNSKGKKDRVIMLSETLLELLRQYFKVYKPTKFLFEGQKSSNYSTSSIRKILKSSLSESKINKPVTVHTLRHSFATHLLENGTDVRIIQKLLGHKSINTTLVYTQVAQSTIQNVKSPLDSL